MPGRWLSCALIRCGSNLVLIDCGEGTQVPWKTAGWGFRQLGAICLTHMHADHVAGLPGVLFMVAHAGRTEPLEIYGPAGTTYVIEGLRRAGPNPTRESFIDAMETIKDWDSGGILPPVSFSKTDHHAQRAGFVCELRDGRFAPLSGWITP